jgi:phosphoglycolate phosphatase-like HAD superfamily hydrolase
VFFKLRLALDLDGTLISCEPRQSAVLAAVLRRRGLEVDLTQIWGLKRKGASTERALALAGLAEATAHAIAKDWGTRIEEPGWLALDKVLPGVLETLEAMRQKDLSLMLLTARRRAEWLPHELRRLQLAQFFDCIAIVRPEAATQQKADCLAEQRVDGFIGDTESDIRAASAAGVKFSAVTTGQRNKCFLSDIGVKSFDSLFEAWRSVSDRFIRQESR